MLHYRSNPLQGFIIMGETNEVTPSVKGDKGSKPQGGKPIIEVSVKQQKGFNVTLSRDSGGKLWAWSVMLADDTDVESKGVSPTVTGCTRAILNAINDMGSLIEDDDDADDDE